MKLYIQGHFSRVALGDLDFYLNNTSGLTIDPTLTEFVADLPSGTINDFLSRAQQTYIIIDGRLYVMGVFPDSISIDGASGLILEPRLLNAGTDLEDGWTSIHPPNYRVFSRTNQPSDGHGFYAINSGRLYFWGTNNTDSGLPSSVTSSFTPNVTQLEEGTANETGWVSVSSGNQYSIGLRNGKLYSWGSNSSGKTGLGISSGTTETPTQIGSSNNWTMVSCGKEHALAINDLGELYSWGSNSSYVTGIGLSSGSTLTPTRVGMNNDWELCSAGATVSMGIRNDGVVYSWGSSVDTGLGKTIDDPDVMFPTEVTTMSGDRIVDLQNSAPIRNWSHTVALTVNGERYMWGDLDQLYIRDNLDAFPDSSLYFSNAGIPYWGFMITPIKMDTIENIQWDKIKVSYYTFMGLGSSIEPVPTPTPTPSADNLSGVNNLFVEWN